MIILLFILLDATGLAPINRDFETEILAEITPLPFPIKKRAELGRHLGIPCIKLHQIEQQALESPDDAKETALKNIVYHWFDRDKSASYATMMSIIFERMENHRDYAAAYEESVVKGDIEIYGCCVTKADIPQILDHILIPATSSKIPEIAQILKVEEPAEEVEISTKLQLILESSLHQKKDNATWKSLVKNMEAIDPNAALNIKQFRSQPNDQPGHEETRRRARTGTLVCIYISYNICMHLLGFMFYVYAHACMMSY